MCAFVRVFVCPAELEKIEERLVVINIHGNRLGLDTAFDVDFDRDISTGPARPHGVVLLPAGKK